MTYWLTLAILLVLLIFKHFEEYFRNYLKPLFIWTFDSSQRSIRLVEFIIYFSFCFLVEFLLDCLIINFLLWIVYHFIDLHLCMIFIRILRYYHTNLPNKHHQTYILSTLIYNICLFKFYYFWIDLKSIIFWILIMNGTALDFESYHIFKFHFNFIFL